MSDTKAPTGEPPTTVGRVAREFTVKERSQLFLVARRFVRHRAATVSIILLVIIVLICYLGRRFWPHDYDWIDGPSLAGPSLQYPMGTDSIGHDYFAQVMRGGQQSLNIAFLVALVSSALGAPYGAIAGFYGGRIDAVMMRIVDVLLTLPLLVVSGTVAHHFRGSWYMAAIILSALGWMVNARVVRGTVLSLREQEFVEAARALGASDLRIICRHLLPNVTGVIIVQATLDIAVAILVEAALSFLGVGIQHPDTSLGLLTSDAKDYMSTSPWLFYSPGLVIIAIALCVNFIGDGLRDALDPRQTRLRR
jgi:ABC-type dipeptide/oligopeptide/nickel transport system permease subunit